MSSLPLPAVSTAVEAAYLRAHAYHKMRFRMTPIPKHLREAKSRQLGFGYEPKEDEIVYVLDLMAKDGKEAALEKISIGWVEQGCVSQVGDTYRIEMASGWTYCNVPAYRIRKEKFRIPLDVKVIHS